MRGEAAGGVRGQSGGNAAKGRRRTAMTAAERLFVADICRSALQQFLCEQTLLAMRASEPVSASVVRLAVR